MELDARMDDLECRQAFQDDTLQALNDVVVEQQRGIERLQLQVAALIKRLEDVQGLVGEAGKTKRLLPIIECTKNPPFGGFSVFRGGQRREAITSSACRPCPVVPPRTPRAGLR